MVRAKNYGTMFKFVNGMPRNTVASFSGHGVYYLIKWYSKLQIYRGTFCKRTRTIEFYRAVHFITKRGIAIARCPSVCLSVCDVGGSGPYRG